MSFTIEITDALAEQLRAEAAARGEDLNNYAVAKLERPLDSEEADADLTEALREGIADGKAGRVLTLEQMNTQIWEAIKNRSAEREQGIGQSVDTAQSKMH